jgi:hypothetical protein
MTTTPFSKPFEFDTTTWTTFVKRFERSKQIGLILKMEPPDIFASVPPRLAPSRPREPAAPKILNLFKRILSP